MQNSARYIQWALSAAISKSLSWMNTRRDVFFSCIRFHLVRHTLRSSMTLDGSEPHRPSFTTLKGASPSWCSAPLPPTTVLHDAFRLVSGWTSSMPSSPTKRAGRELKLSLVTPFGCVSSSSSLLLPYFQALPRAIQRMINKGEITYIRGRFVSRSTPCVRGSMGSLLKLWLT